MQGLLKLLSTWLLFIVLTTQAQRVIPLPSLKEQASIEQSFTDERISTVLPKLMSQYGIDAFLLSMREYGEDNVFWAVKSSVQFASRRRTVIVFFLQGDSVVRNDFVDNTDEIWSNLNAILERYDPQTIALNVDPDFAFSDGLHAGEKEILESKLTAKFKSRIVRQPLLALDFIATRVDIMLPRYKEIVETVWAVITEGFSSAVVTPDVTSTNDVVWWFREKIQELGYGTWFQPSVNVFREGVPAPFSGVIRRGDMLWVDIGFKAYNLHTDTQHLGYVLKANETDVPAGMKNGLRSANIMQDILMEELKVGRTGNEILLTCRDVMSSRGINGTFYSHPLGDDGHAAGTLIGYWDIQQPVPIRGDVKVIPNTWYSIELEATVPIPEWGNQAVSFKQEEDMYIDGNGDNYWVYGRQTEFHIVK